MEKTPVDRLPYHIRGSVGYEKPACRDRLPQNKTGQETEMSRTLRASFIVLAAIVAAATGSTGLSAQTRPKVTTLGPDFPKTEIFIGNSFFYYNNSMHSHVLAMERAADPEHKADFRATSVTISGSGFDWHDTGSYFRPNAIGNYSFDEQTTSFSTSSTNCSTWRS
jgi:hypothetical protein